MSDSKSKFNNIRWEGAPKNFHHNPFLRSLAINKYINQRGGMS